MLPNKKDLKDLIKRVKRYMLENPDLFWNVETEQYECELTIGCDGVSKDFGYQTGDNSYTGGAYGYPYWAVITITNYSTLKDMTDEELDNLRKSLEAGNAVSNK